jgi:hypothetical protein
VDGQSGTTGIAPGSAGDVVGSSPPVGDASSGCTLDDAVAVQVERVETLLAAVRDIVSSLGATSAQLEREVAQALRPPPAGVAHPSPRRAGAAHVAADRTAGRHGAETTAGHESLEAERAALLEAAEHRAVIEQAKGMLMLKHRCDADAAFNLLLEISRRERRKVRDIAADLVRAGSTPRPLVDLTAHNGHSPATAGGPGGDEAGSRDR